MSTFFPYETISEFFENEGDFLENLEEQDLAAVEDDLHPCCEHCTHTEEIAGHLAPCWMCEVQGCPEHASPPPDLRRHQDFAPQRDLGPGGDGPAVRGHHGAGELRPGSAGPHPGVLGQGRRVPGRAGLPRRDAAEGEVMRLHVITVGGSPIQFDLSDPTDEQREALAILAERFGHIVTDKPDTPRS